MPPATPSEALTAARFSLTVDGHEIAAFSELLGIISEVLPADHLPADHMADGDAVVRKLPGASKPPTVVLKRGKNTSLELWAWHEAVRTGDVAAARKSCSLTMYNLEGKPVARYWLEHAWPSKLEVGGLTAGAGQAMSETVTIVCEHLQRVSV